MFSFCRFLRAPGLRRSPWISGLLITVLHTPMASSAELDRSLAAATVPNGFGISLHYLGKQYSQIDEIAEAGFKIIRIDLTWEKSEKSPGQFDWQYYDELLNEFKKREIRPLLVLDYSNSLYMKNVTFQNKQGQEVTKTAAPSNESERQHFLQWAQEAAVHFKNFDPIWEIWNEPEADSFWPPRSDPSSYSALANSACRALKSTLPSAFVISAGLGAKATPTPQNPKPPFFDTMLAQLDLACFDGISVHPYLQNRAIEETSSVWHLVREAISSHATAGVVPPAPISSEWGLSTYRNLLSETQQATYLAKMMLFNSRNAVPISILYDWQDDGDGDQNAENRYGITTRNGARKPAFDAIKAMTKILNGFHYYCSLSRDTDGYDLFLFSNSGGDKFIATSWSKRGTYYLTPNQLGEIRLDSALDMLGNRVDISSLSKEKHIELSESPEYLIAAEINKKIVDKNCQ